jgi:hypothetical protein
MSAGLVATAGALIVAGFLQLEVQNLGHGTLVVWWIIPQVYLEFSCEFSHFSVLPGFMWRDFVVCFVL